MFKLFRRKSKPLPESLPGPETFTDHRLITVIRSTFEASQPVVGALFLVAYENLHIYYTAFVRAAKEEKNVSPTMEGFAKFLAGEHAKWVTSSTESEINSRRFFYLYTAAMLNIAHARARARPELWDEICAVWIALLPGARGLRKTIDTTALWKPSETEFFATIQTEQEGEHYCLSFLVPPEIRFHERIKEWLEKDLPPEVRAELRAMDRQLFGARSKTDQ